MTAARCRGSGPPASVHSDCPMARSSASKSRNPSPVRATSTAPETGSPGVNPRRTRSALPFPAGNDLPFQRPSARRSIFAASPADSILRCVEEALQREAFPLEVSGMGIAPSELGEFIAAPHRTAQRIERASGCRAGPRSRARVRPSTSSSRNPETTRWER